MSFGEFYDGLRGYLKVSATVTGKVGSAINVGERFTLTVSGANMSPYAQVVFTNPHIMVVGTQYARPIGGATVNMALADTVLHPGESSTVDIKMEAISEIPGFWEDLFSSEDIARVRIYADLDQNRLFRVWNRGVVYHEIDPGKAVVRSGSKVK